jgi:peptidoglycan/LPS O-acetylase OafA/YrhL
VSTRPDLHHRRNDEIEVLRAVAILFTLFHHTAYYLLASPNILIEQVYPNFTFWGGVDLFFVISGFVIMKSLRRSLADFAPKVGMWRVMISFWIRRIWRILPSAWLWLFIFVGASYVYDATGAMGDFPINFRDGISALLQFANYHGYQCANRIVACGPSGIYWSLSLEEQFYILLPLSILIFRKNFPYVLILALLPQLLVERFEWSLGWAFRFDTLIWGVLLALWSEHTTYKKYQPRFMKFKFVKWVIVPASLFLMAFIPQYKNGIPLATTLLGLDVLFLVYLASYDEGYLMSSGFFRNILLWFGSRSYSLYLIHIFTFRIAYEILYQYVPESHQITAADVPTVVAIAYPLLFILSELNYRYVETPLRNFGIKKAKRYLK